MALVRWQATVQDDAGAIVINPSITVRNAADNSIATIYNDAGVVKTNPFIGSSEGFVSFKALPGRYIIQGVAGGQNAPDWVVDIQSAANVFDTRAEFVAANTSNPTLHGGSGVVVSAGGLDYLRMVGSTAISDLPGWVPFGDVTPNHFATNTNPGVTDMTAALQAAVNYSSRVHGMAEDYRISDTIYFREFGTSGFQECGFHGKGPLVTRIIQSDETKDAFAVIRNNQTATFLTVPSFRDFSIHISVSASNVSDCAGIRTRQAINGEYVNVHIFGPQWGFANERVGQCRFDGCFYQGGWSRKTKGMFLWTHDPFNNSGNCYGNFVSNCESSGSAFGTATIHDIEAVDGLYITNCHWNHCTTGYRIGADGTGGKNKAVSIYVSNTYHDYNPTTPKVTDIEMSRMSGAANSFDVWGIGFVGGVFRTESATARMLGFSFASAFDLVGLSRMSMVSVTGADIRGYRGCSVDMTLPAGFDAKALLDTWTISGNKLTAPEVGGGGATKSGIVLSGTGISVEGNVFTGAWTDSTFPPVFIGSRADKVSVGDGNVYNCTRTNPLSIDAAATNVNCLRHASYANDASAATAGVPIRGIYRGADGNIKWRMV